MWRVGGNILAEVVYELNRIGYLALKSAAKFNLNKRGIIVVFIACLPFEY